MPFKEKIVTFAVIIKLFCTMNIKLHTPTTLKAGSGMSSVKQFLLSLIATTVSIVLTFGTAAVIDHHKKQAAKKEMVMMVINDMDKTIEQIMVDDTAFSEASRLEQELAIHPEYYDSLRFNFTPVMTLLGEEFPETVEKIFTTNIETFNTIGDANFVNEVSSFYILRHKYKEVVIDKLRDEATSNDEAGIAQSMKALFAIDFPELYYNNWVYLESLKEIRDRCMRMMKISEKDMKSFTEKHVSEDVNTERDSIDMQKLKELVKAEKLVFEALEKLQN